MTNTLWIGANLLFDVETGKTTQVLQFVFREEDATTWTEEAAKNQLSFVESRAARYAVIRWSVEQSSARRGLFVIRGVQEVKNG